jgi:hypothetical protein
MELKSSLDKRMFLLPHGQLAQHQSKRFNTKGTKTGNPAKFVANLGDSFVNDAKPQDSGWYV